MKKLQKNLMIWLLCLCLCAGFTACGGGGAGNSKDVEVTKEEWLAAIDSYPQANCTFTYYTEKSYTGGIRVDGILYQTGDSERGSSVIRWKDVHIYGYGYGSDRGVSDMLNGFETVIEWSRERYDEFTFQDGVYFCKSISLPSESEETSFDFKDVKIEFSDKKLASVTFLWLQERIKCYCDAFGTTSVTPPEGYTGVSDGLTFSLTDGANGVTVTGIGTEQNKETIIIPHYYERKQMIAIGDRAFYNCGSIKQVAIPNTVETIGANAFEGCKALNYAVLPYNLTSVGASAFEGCSELSEVTVTPKLTSVGERAFAGCTSLRWITMERSFMPTNSSSIGAWAFSGCTSFAEFILPFDITEINEGTFSACVSLKSMSFPSSVVKIGERAMEGCTSLARISLYKGLSSIAARAFAGCQALEEITFYGTVDEWLAVQKESGWNDGTGEYMVICSDGTVTKDGTIEKNAAA